MNSAGGRALENKEEKKKEQKKELTIEHLPLPIKRKIISFLVDDPVQDHLVMKKISRKNFSSDRFFFNLDIARAIPAAQAIYNLVHRIQVDATLKFIRQRPEILSIRCPIEIPDIHGQRIKGRPVQILAAVDEFDHVERKADDKAHHGFIPILRSYAEDQKDFDSQIQEQFKEGHELATKKHMARYMQAIKIFIADVVKSSDVSNDVPFDMLLDLPIVNKFREALKPSAEHVVTMGLAWDGWQMYLDFIAMFEASFGKLGGKWSLKSDLVDAVVHPALQIRGQFSHLEIFKKGFGKVAAGQLPDRIDCSNGRPAILAGIGTTDFFGFYGGIYPRGADRGGRLSDGARFSKLLSNRNNNIAQLCGQMNQVRAAR